MDIFRPLVGPCGQRYYFGEFLHASLIHIILATLGAPTKILGIASLSADTVDFMVCEDLD